MAVRHLIQRLSPQLDRRWIIALVVLALLVAAGTFVRWGGTLPPLELVALGAQGTFEDTVTIPASWAGPTRDDPDIAARVPLVLGVRNPGLRPVTPERLELSLPVRFRGRRVGPLRRDRERILEVPLRPQGGQLERGGIAAPADEGARRDEQSHDDEGDHPAPVQLR